MTSVEHAQRNGSYVLLGRIVAGLVFAGAVAFVVSHESTRPLPESISPEVAPFTNMEARIASGDAIKDLVNLMISVSFGLTAIIGFALRDGLGMKAWQKALNPIALSLFVYFLARVLVYAYDTYAALAVQLDSGYAFVTRLNPLIIFQARALTIAGVLALGILAIKLVSTRT